MTDGAPAAAAGPEPAEVERVFRGIRDTAMADVPILNHALDVAAVGFTDWQGYRLGVLVTPRFMNLMLFPGRNPAWPDLRVGQTRRHVLPAGEFEFLVGEHAELGRYLACSLFSPVFEFEDQPAAVATAEAVMDAVLEPPAEAPAAPPAGTAEGTRPGEAELRPVSRRDFIRGRRGEAGPGGGSR